MMLVAVVVMVVATACTRGVQSALPDPVAPDTAAATSTTSSTSTTTSTSTSTSSTSTTSTSSSTSTTTVPVIVTTPPPTSTTSTTTSTTSTTPAPTVPPTTDVRSSIWEVRPPSTIPPPPIPPDWVGQVIGTSVLGREIVALHRPVDAPRARVLVIGAIHGNEPVSPPIVRALVDVPVPADVEVWLVPEMNPDAVAAGTRANANGVELNRNFGWEWRAHDGGPAPFSEPETQAVAHLVESLRPNVVVWVHQPLGYVSSIGTTPDAYEQAWSRGSGTRVRPDVTQHGGGESWTNMIVGLPAMLIEVDTWEATPEMVAAHRNGFAELVAVLD